MFFGDFPKQAPSVTDTWDSKIVQYGEMHEAIGKQQHYGRVQLNELVGRDHFYAVAALEKLAGEITIFDGKVIITRVDANGKPQSQTNDSALNENAAMLVGAYVPAWTEKEVTESIAPDKIEKFILESASEAGVDTAKPFAFTVEGQLTDVRMHVINGACPMHARLNRIELPSDRQPVEMEYDKVQGTLVGVFAVDSVGKLTHPSTSTHTHLILENGSAGSVTGHVEQVGVVAGSVLRLPLVKND
jgi:alpha-acetolactate decarboxylase